MILLKPIQYKTEANLLAATRSLQFKFEISIFKLLPIYYTKKHTCMNRWTNKYYCKSNHFEFIRPRRSDISIKGHKFKTYVYLIVFKLQF